MTTETIEAPAIALQIAEYSPLAAGLADLRHRFAGVVFDLSTTKGDKEARQARQELVKLRGTLEAKRKELKAPALERSRLIDDEAKRIAAEILALEQPIDEAIKAAETRKEAERLARAQAEQARLDNVQKRIRAFGSFAIRAMGEPSATIADLIRELVALEPTQPVFEEFLPTAQQAHADALAGLRVLHDKTVAQEVESQRLADERAELDRQRAADEAERKAEQDRIALERHNEAARLKAERDAQELELRRQRDAEEQERERVADIREQISGYGRAVDMMAGSSSQDLMAACNGLPAPKPGQFAELQDDAQVAFDAAVARLETMYRAAFDQEQQAAANARKEAELAEQQQALDKQRAEQEAAEQARKEAAAAEQRRVDEERRQQQEREDAARAEQQRIEREQREAAEAEANAARERLHQAAAQMLEALAAVMRDNGFPMLSMDTQELVDTAITAAE